MPAASVNSAPRNVGNWPEREAGTNSRQPAVIVSSPIVAVRMYPKRFTSAAPGIETTKYAAKKANWTVITSK
jgi:hypothetical protein